MKSEPEIEHLLDRIRQRRDRVYRVFRCGGISEAAYFRCLTLTGYGTELLIAELLALRASKAAKQ